MLVALANAALRSSPAPLPLQPLTSPGGGVDVHAHLTDSAFSGNLQAVLEQSSAAGVSAIIAVSEDLEDARHVMEFIKGRKQQQQVAVHICLGMHPCKVRKRIDSKLSPSLAFAQGFDLLPDFLQYHFISVRRRSVLSFWSCRFFCEESFTHLKISFRQSLILYFIDR